LGSENILQLGQSGFGKYFAKLYPKTTVIGSILQFDGVGLERLMWFDVLGLGNIPPFACWFLKVFCIGHAGFWKYSAFERVCFGKDSSFRRGWVW
jgi:hypothetical protein